MEEVILYTKPHCTCSSQTLEEILQSDNLENLFLFIAQCSIPKNWMLDFSKAFFSLFGWLGLWLFQKGACMVRELHRTGNSQFLCSLSFSALNCCIPLSKVYPVPLFPSTEMKMIMT